jgi:DMSO/TMAO reductase YedYZ molybdopterin-dependent catalytic subunit
MTPPSNQASRFNGRVVRCEEPLNLESPFEMLDGFVTPTASFYVRTHFPVPNIKKEAWRLRVEGEVEEPFEISFAGLLELPQRTIPATLECAGNSRSFLERQVAGVQWGLGAVGNAEWTGVPLSLLLDRAGIRRGACEVVLEGADAGKLNDPRAPAGELHFARSIPLEKARADVILACKMNGAALLPEHGFPVRAIVPGWYAVASIKWLRRIIVAREPFNGYYQTLDYAYWRREGNTARLTPLSELQVKAQIARPRHGEIVQANATIAVHGAAWTGNGEITSVEISANGGVTWKKCNLLGESKPHAWQRWVFQWETPSQSGKAVLVARATDSLGRTQPGEHDPDRGAYIINHLLPITVEVR